MVKSLGQHAALVAISERLEDGERLLAFLDDLCVVSTPERTCCCVQYFARRVVATCQDQRAPRNDAHLESWWCCPRQVRRSRKCSKGRGPERPEFGGVRGQTRGPGNHHLGQEFVERELAKIIADHSELLTRIPEVQDLQCAWLLLLYCGAARPTSTFTRISNLAVFLQSVEDQTRCSGGQCENSHKFATCGRGIGVERCAQVAGSSTLGKLGDFFKMVWARHPDIEETIMQAVDARDEAPSVQAINQSRESLVQNGLAGKGGTRGGVILFGQPEVDFVRRRRRDAQAPRWASSPFISFPTNRTSRLEPQLLRVLFLRRLRPPLPLSARACRCRPLDVLGHHRSACAVVGTLVEGSLSRMRLQKSAEKRWESATSFATWILEWWSSSMHEGSRSW